jgi:hypothetical protein
MRVMRVTVSICEVTRKAANIRAKLLYINKQNKEFGGERERERERERNERKKKRHGEK